MSQETLKALNQHLSNAQQSFSAGLAVSGTQKLDALALFKTALSESKQAKQIYTTAIADIPELKNDKGMVKKAQEITETEQSAKAMKTMVMVQLRMYNSLPRNTLKPSKRQEASEAKSSGNYNPDFKFANHGKLATIQESTASQSQDPTTMTPASPTPEEGVVKRFMVCLNTPPFFKGGLRGILTLYEPICPF